MCVLFARLIKYPEYFKAQRLNNSFAIIDLCYSVERVNPSFGGLKMVEAKVEPKIVRIENLANEKDKNIISKAINIVPIREVSDAIMVNLEQTEVLEKWPEFLVKIKKYNHSLSFVLQNCQPQDVKNSRLCLIFKYKFHQDRVNDIAIKNIIETTLAEVYGVTLVLNSVIDENLEIKREEREASAPIISAGEADNNIKTGGLIGDLLKTFGGEVIN